MPMAIRNDPFAMLGYYKNLIEYDDKYIMN
jgi:hypothetical protein